MPFGEKYAAKSQSQGISVPGTPLPSSTATSSAISNLNAAISDAHGMIEALISISEPHLPRYLFDHQEAAEGEAKAELVQRVNGYSESTSSVVNSINSATNEVDRLARRIDFLRERLVT